MSDYEELKLRQEAEAIYRIATSNAEYSKILDLIVNTLENYVEIGFQAGVHDGY